MNERSVSIIISLIWGIGIALLFRRICKDGNCTVVKVPLQFNSDGFIYSRNKCYKLHKYLTKCEY